MANVFNELLKAYELFNVKEIIPVAHTRVKPDIMCLLDDEANLRVAMVNTEKERVTIPCTIDSESRTGGVAPHPIHDNLKYLSKSNSNYHEPYMEQLKEYVSETDDGLAKIVYKYLCKGTIESDLLGILDLVSYPDKPMIIFITPTYKETISKVWTNYYVSKLPVNGVCSITGEKAHIPSKYPKGIRESRDMAKLFISENTKPTEMTTLGVGYETGQKITHTLQCMCYEGYNWAKTEIEKLGDEANMIVDSYAFFKEREQYLVIDLGCPRKLAYLSKNGDVLKTTMSVFEANIVKGHFNRNKGIL